MVESERNQPIDMVSELVAHTPFIHLYNNNVEKKDTLCDQVSHLKQCSPHLRLD